MKENVVQFFFTAISLFLLFIFLVHVPYCQYSYIKKNMKTNCVQVGQKSCWYYSIRLWRRYITIKHCQNLNTKELATHLSVFDIVCTVHRNHLHKQTNKMHFSMYLFYNCFVHSTCFEWPFRSSSGVHKLLYLQLCKNRANVRLHGLYTAAEYSKSWTPDDERNGHSKHVVYKKIVE